MDRDPAWQELVAAGSGMDQDEFPSGQADPSQQRTFMDEGSLSEPMSEDQIWTLL